MMDSCAETIELEVKKYVNSIIVRDEFLRDAYAPKFIAEKTLYGMTRILCRWEVLGKKLADVAWPATWWDAFKERWYPAWAKKKWPVRYNRIHVDELVGISPRVEEPTRIAITGDWDFH